MLDKQEQWEPTYPDPRDQPLSILVRQEPDPDPIPGLHTRPCPVATPLTCARRPWSSPTSRALCCCSSCTFCSSWARACSTSSCRVTCSSGFTWGEVKVAEWVGGCSAQELRAHTLGACRSLGSEASSSTE